MRHRIEIQTATKTRAADGGVVRTWFTVATRWGSVAPINADETTNAEQIQRTRTHDVRMRYYSGLTAGQRLKVGSRVFNIAQILNPDERNIETQILCKEETS